MIVCNCWVHTSLTSFSNSYTTLDSLKRVYSSALIAINIILQGLAFEATKTRPFFMTKVHKDNARALCMGRGFQETRSQKAAVQFLSEMARSIGADGRFCWDSRF